MLDICHILHVLRVHLSHILPVTSSVRSLKFFSDHRVMSRTFGIGSADKHTHYCTIGLQESLSAVAGPGFMLLFIRSIVRRCSEDEGSVERAGLSVPVRPRREVWGLDRCCGTQRAVRSLWGGGGARGGAARGGGGVWGGQLNGGRHVGFLLYTAGDYAF